MTSQKKLNFSCKFIVKEYVKHFEYLENRVNKKKINLK